MSDSSQTSVVSRMLLSGVTLAAGTATGIICSSPEAGAVMLAIGGIVSAISGLSGNILASDAHKLLDRPVPDHDSRRWNHDILRASVLAVSDIIKKQAASQPPATAASLIRLAETVSTHYDRIDEPAPLAVVTEQEVRESIFLGDAFKHTPSGNAQTWTAFLHHIVQGIPNLPNIPQAVMESVGGAICEGFNNQLFQVLKFDFDAQGSPIKGRAYAAVTLDLLNHIAQGNGKILTLIETLRTENTATHSSLAGLHEKLDALSTIDASRLRAHLTEASGKALARDLAEAEAIRGDWQKRQKLTDAAHAAHQQRLSRVNELAEEFASLQTGGNASATLSEMLRILDEESIDSAIAYIASQSTRLLSKATAKTEAARADLQPLLTGAQLAVANGLNEQAETLFQQLLAPSLPDWPQARHEYIVYLNHTKGSGQETHGSLAAALATYHEAMRHSLLLTLQYPENTQWQFDLSVSHFSLGDVAIAQGDLRTAADAYSACLEIAKALIGCDPENTQWLRAFSVSKSRLGDIAMAQGDLPAAAEAYAEGVKISEALAARDTENTDWQRVLAFNREKTGDLAAARGDLPAARNAYTAAIALQGKLVRRDPENTDWQRDLSISLGKLGHIAKKWGLLPTATTAYTEEMKIAKALAERDPQNMEWRRDLSLCHDNLGDIAMAQGNLPAAAEEYTNRLEIAQALAARDPANSDWQHDLFVGHYKLATIAGKRGNEAVALDHYRQSHDILQALADKGKHVSPQDMEWLAILKRKFADG